ncbi:MAG: phosphoribosylanthranilate isomerase [Planctomycetota bacterium]
MFHIKICGVKVPADVDAVAHSGGDAIGLNFFPPSIRYVDPSTACRLSRQAATRQLKRIGVFANHSVQQIRDVLGIVELDAVQLHGDEPVDVGEALRNEHVDLIRAVKLPVGPIDPKTIERLVSPWTDLQAWLLLDADAGSMHGGSGKVLDWDSIASWASRFERRHWTLAGGLDPDNVAEAIQRSHATSVDVASGSEQPRGVKSTQRIHQFIAAAGEAFKGRSGTPK